MKDRDSATLRLPFSHHSHLWSHTIMSTVDAIPSIKLAPSSIFLYTSEDAWSRQPASHLPAVQALGQKKSHTYLSVPPLDDDGLGCDVVVMWMTMKSVIVNHSRLWADKTNAITDWHLDNKPFFHSDADHLCWYYIYHWRMTDRPPDTHRQPALQITACSLAIH